MILEGNERGYGAELAHHLLNPRDNEHVSVHAVNGFVADDLFGAFIEAEAISHATQCQNYLFSLSLNPPTGADVPVSVFEDTVRRIEQKLGLSGQPRILVFHEKLGRRHAHCVWSRIDAGRMKAINLSNYKRKLMDISRALYREQNWEMPEGFIDPDKRKPDNHSRQEAGQAKRAKLDAKAQKALFRRCWDQSDGLSAFAAALWSEGYALACGDRRGFVAVDANGKIWSLSRWCGVKPKDLRARLGSEDLLWTIEEALVALQSLDTPLPTKGTLQPDPNFERKRAELIARQREERADLLAKQEARRIEALAALQSELPNGLKVLWLKVTGRYAHFVERTEEAANEREAADRAETEALIRRHLRERRDLDRQRYLTDLSVTLEESFEAALRSDPRQRLVLPRDDLPFSEAELLKRPDLVLNHISYQDARFTQTDIARELGKRIKDPMALKTAVEAVLSSHQLVRLDNTKRTAFTTRDYQQAERVLLEGSQALARSTGRAVKRGRVKQVIANQNRKMRQAFGGALSKEQEAAIEHITGGEQLSLIVGLAGSGKSTMLRTAHEAWAHDCIKVHGAALAGKAAEGLETASGIPSRTLASLETSWKNGYAPIAAGDVLVVDEAGMLGTRQLMRLTAKMQEIGAKLVLVGDPDQLQPIEAGTPFRTLIDTYGAVRLTEIHRQKDAWQRQASKDLAQGRVVEAIQSYANHGAVRTGSGRDQALAALVEDYLVDVELNGANRTRLAFAHRRKDVYALNQAIRAGIRTGQLKIPEVLIQTDTGPRAFAKGDRIAFTRNDKAMGIKNGMLGTVTTASEDMLTIHLDSHDGSSRTLTLNPKTYTAFDHGYATTIHKSQGATVDRSFVLASKTMDTPLTYVAMTRHRETMRLYVNERDRPRQMGGKRPPRLIWSSGKVPERRR